MKRIIQRKKKQKKEEKEKEEGINRENKIKNSIDLFWDLTFLSFYGLHYSGNINFVLRLLAFQQPESHLLSIATAAGGLTTDLLHVLHVVHHLNEGRSHLGIDGLTGLDHGSLDVVLVALAARVGSGGLLLRLLGQASGLLAH